ncbi:lysophospholipid acyltransferase 5 [Lutzomyia longipalpis]|uniref:lysophospholipid acyltransferase 5 n=1 Tax=Lutzomyia longipalpis TaxID=7200 RepID=UPI00248397F8|nr:lysophospholipid acyltransferase 5 [Lutzomyia longipalpis]XP_055678980.1 lysophospholipid acyltransferase 5 [Lutzomyia longipalpis]XP_055678981.1 lysophospholipid acyltransferase 5 [Lutzomyia longipalpis]
MSSPGLIGQLAGAVGATEPALRLLISVVLGYPLSLFYRNFIWPLPELQQHIFMIISGMTICLFNYGSDVYHSILAILATYILIKVLGPTKKLMIASFAFHMTHLLFGYIMTGTDNYDIVWTMPHCVLVLRLIGLTFDICDTFGSHKKGDEPKEMDVYGIKKMPNLLQISSYTYFPGSFLAGPQFPYHQYERFLGKEFEKYQGFVDAGLKRFGLGFMYLAIFQILNIFASDTYLLSEDYASAGYFKRLIFLGIWGRLTLYKYMSVWLLSEGACTRFGLTFRNVKEGKEDWSAGENVKIWRLEQANRFTHYIESFNVATNHWVARHIYKRLKFLGSREISQASTLFFLAIWHGFHSGYYASFAMEFIVVFIERDFDSIVKGNEKLRRLLEHPHLQPVYFVLLKFYAIVGMGWCLVPFAFLSFSKYWAIFRAVHFLGYVYALAYIGIHFILKALFPRDKSRAVPEKSQ